ncbi:MAG TPA: hypothetical protein VE685_25305 [Thermoanaerobaculia bacterium]|nr:hypothetical protein [Thermoanaerobaculia bacterium]
MQKKRVSLPHFILPILMLLSAVLAQPAQGVEYWGSIGTGVGRPAASRNNDGRLEVFVRRADGALWHRWTDPNAPDGWSAWQTLGGPITGDPIVARAADGRLEVFALNSRALVHKWRSGASPESSWSASWTQIAANIASDPAMILNSAGVLQVFARATDASIGYSVQQSALPGAAWTSWASLGGFVSGVPAAAVNADGRAEVFARTPDGIIWHKWETAAGGPWSAWWFNLDGTVASHPVVGRNSDGRLEVFAITSSGLLWHRRQSTAGATTDWTAGATLGGDVLGRVAGTTGNLTGTPALAIGDGGRLGVIARSTDGRWWSKWQKAASSDIWSVWTSLCGISASEPVVAPPQNGDPHLVLRASDGVLWQKKCDKACRGNRGKSVPVLTSVRSICCLPTVRPVLTVVSGDSGVSTI